MSDFIRQDMSMEDLDYLHAWIKFLAGDVTIHVEDVGPQQVRISIHDETLSWINRRSAA